MSANQSTGGRRRGSSLNFALVGEGSDARIFAFASISSMTQSDNVGSVDGCDLGWLCVHCSYENADVSNPRCSVCGLRKDSAAAATTTTTTTAPPVSTTEKVGRIPRNGLRSSMKKEMSFSVECLMEDDQLVSPLPKSPPNNNNNNNKGGGPKTLDKELAMSYANWSISDSEGWICPACTFLNQGLHLTCEICHQQRPKKLGMPAAVSRGISTGTATAAATNMLPSLQESVQDFLHASIKPELHHQEDYLKRQCDIIQKLEERSLEEERMKEIAAMQQQLLATIEQNDVKIAAITSTTTKNNNAHGTRIDPETEAQIIVHDTIIEIEEAKKVLEKTQESIRRLEMIRQKQKEEQLMISEVIARNSRVFKTEETNLIEADDKSRAAVPDEEDDNNNPQGTSTPAELLAQQKMLDFWKEQFLERENQMQELRRQQETLLQKIQSQSAQ